MTQSQYEQASKVDMEIRHANMQTEFAISSVNQMSPLFDGIKTELIDLIERVRDANIRKLHKQMEAL